MSDATHSVVLRLDPAALEDPDLEIRWEIETILRSDHPDLSFSDDGYGFARQSDAMLLSYATSEPERFVEALVGILEHKIVSGNRLAPAAMVAVAARVTVAAGQEFVNHRVVFPAHAAGNPIPD